MITCFLLQEGDVAASPKVLADEGLEAGEGGGGCSRVQNKNVVLVHVVELMPDDLLVGLKPLHDRGAVAPDSLHHLVEHPLPHQGLRVGGSGGAARARWRRGGPDRGFRGWRRGRLRRGARRGTRRWAGRWARWILRRRARRRLGGRLRRRLRRWLRCRLRGRHRGRRRRWRPGRRQRWRWRRLGGPHKVTPAVARRPAR